MDDSIKDGINDVVRAMFQSLRLNLLGPDAISRAYAFVLKDSQYDPQTTMDSMYLQANAINNPDIQDLQEAADSDTLQRIKSVAEQYVSQLEEKTVADVQQIVSSYYNDAELQAKLQNKTIQEVLSENKDLLNSVSEKLADIQEKVKKAVNVLVDNELHTAQNYGAMDGIIAASKAIGIDDPTVCKIGVLDDKRCKHCWRLWTLDDKITPRVYKLSELKASPGHWKNPAASLSPTHPNCRDVLVTIMPGFGFDGSGKIVYKGIDPETNQPWDEYRHQRSRL